MTEPAPNPAPAAENLDALDERPLAAGVAALEAAVKTLPNTPGVYRMIAADGAVLYVGKAKDLRKRVVSYTKPDRLSIRIRRMVARTASLEVVTTHTEAEALLLESNLIKTLSPRYNVLLRDDKSFPAILVTGDHPFPQVLKHRGARSRKGEYFGPFASAWAVNHALGILQRAFKLRTCTDNVFSNRKRPCLLYQIKRCAAPCVGRISEAEYGALVDQARAFLMGRSRELQADLAARMQAASDGLDFELAADLRDRIRAMASVQAHQDIHLSGVADADVLAVHQERGVSCVQVFFFRGGANFGNRAYFPAQAADAEPAEVLEAFAGQFYAVHPPPPLVLLSIEVPGQAVLAEALGSRAGRKVEVAAPRRGDKRRAVDHALVNAREALLRRLAESASQRRLLDGLAQCLNLDAPPERVEVYDNSHIQGANAVGAMIVAGPEGLTKNAYRTYNIRRDGDDFRPGDDFAMMREVLTRRFGRALRERDEGATAVAWPDLLIIDGGAGQLKAAQDILTELGIDDVAVIAIAKGPDRNAGRERIFQPGREPFRLEPNDPVLHFLQRLRDEAHRFAIGAHRAKRSRGLSQSRLDEVPGIGGARKKALLHHFGSAAAVTAAGLADLELVPGISRATAKKIYDFFHPEG